jgi:hypothetical protein
VKLLYDDQNIYAIFRVQDRYVKAVAQTYDGNVWQDSCVEFFFAPWNEKPMQYFNFEVNCGGTGLLHYNRVPRRDFEVIDTADMGKIEIAHSLPRLVDPEITEPVTWTLEYRLPIRMLEIYARCTHPRRGITWRANFYKCGDETSNPHWLTWSEITNNKLDFHQPQFFGVLEFM